MLNIICKKFGEEYCKPVTVEQLHLQTGMPMRVVTSLLYNLKAANLVDDVSGGGKDVAPAYKPAEALHNITVGAMIDRLEAAGVSWKDNDEWPSMESEKWKEVVGLRDKYIKELRQVPIMEL